jgi:hypothetical protein
MLEGPVDLQAVEEASGSQSGAARGANVQRRSIATVSMLILISELGAMSVASVTAAELTRALRPANGRAALHELGWVEQQWASAVQRATSPRISSWSPGRSARCCCRQDRSQVKYHDWSSHESSWLALSGVSADERGYQNRRDHRGPCARPMERRFFVCAH